MLQMCLTMTIPTLIHCLESSVILMVANLNGKPLILCRDGNQCVICGSKDSLHVHHLIPFKSILDRIIIQNYPLSPVDDADKLYEIAVKDKELNNPNNLITVCSMCHHKIHGQL